MNRSRVLIQLFACFDRGCEDQPSIGGYAVLIYTSSSVVHDTEIVPGERMSLLSKPFAAILPLPRYLGVLFHKRHRPCIEQTHHLDWRLLGTTQPLRPVPYVDSQKVQQLQADTARRVPPYVFTDSGLHSNNVAGGAQPELLSVELVPLTRANEAWQRKKAKVEQTLQQIRRENRGHAPSSSSGDAFLWQQLIAVNQRYGLGLAIEPAADDKGLAGVWSCDSGTLKIDRSLSGSYTWNSHFGGGKIEKAGDQRAPDDRGKVVDWTVFYWNEPRRPKPRNGGWWRVTYKRRTGKLYVYWGFNDQRQRLNDGRPAGGFFSCVRTR